MYRYQNDLLNLMANVSVDDSSYFETNVTFL